MTYSKTGLDLVWGSLGAKGTKGKEDSLSESYTAGLAPEDECLLASS